MEQPQPVSMLSQLPVSTDQQQQQTSQANGDLQQKPTSGETAQQQPSDSGPNNPQSPANGSGRNSREQVNSNGTSPLSASFEKQLNLVPLLSDLCIEAIIRNFKEYPRLNLPKKYSTAIYSRVPLDMPLNKVLQYFGHVPMVQQGSGKSGTATPAAGTKPATPMPLTDEQKEANEIYWKRLCQYCLPRYKCDAKQHGGSWISTFFECLIENFVENNNLHSGPAPSSSPGGSGRASANLLANNNTSNLNSSLNSPKSSNTPMNVSRSGSGTVNTALPTTVTLSNSTDTQLIFEELLKMAHPYVKRLNLKNIMPNEWYGPQALDKIVTTVQPHKLHTSGQSEHRSKPKAVKLFSSANELLSFGWDEKLVVTDVKNTINEPGIRYSHAVFGVLMKGLPNLEHLSISSTIKDQQLAYDKNLLGISSEDAYIISRYSVNLRHLTTLELKCCHITDEICENLVRGFEFNDILQRIDLSHNLIGDVGAEHVSHYLEKHTQSAKIAIKSLSLRGNKFSKVGLEHIARSLSTNTRLLSLDLSLNPQCQDGIPKFFEYMADNNITLQELLLAGCGLGEDSMKSLCYMFLAQNSVNAKLLDKIRNKNNPQLAEDEKVLASKRATAKSRSKTAKSPPKTAASFKSGRQTAASNDSGDAFPEDEDADQGAGESTEASTIRKLKSVEPKRALLKEYEEFLQFPCGISQLDLSANPKLNTACALMLIQQCESVQHFVKHLDFRGTGISVDERQKIDKALQKFNNKTKIAMSK